MTAAAVPVQPASRINTGFVVLIAASAAIGGFLFGFDSAVINGAVPGIQAELQLPGAGPASPWPRSCSGRRSAP